MAKKNENTTSIGFEEKIWRAADKLCGNLDASEYKGVVLGLIFLKYISDRILFPNCAMTAGQLHNRLLAKNKASRSHIIKVLHICIIFITYNYNITSSNIIRAKPTAKRMVLRLVCSPLLASGINSSTTT